MRQSLRIEISPGNFYDLCSPEPHRLTVRLIAHNLSRINRFAGVPERSISVAEHSYWASVMVDTSDLPSAQQAALRRIEALLHDAPEGCGLADMASPLKPELPEYVNLEARSADCIGNKFGVDISEKSRAIHDVDCRLGLTEKLTFVSKLGLDLPEWKGFSARFKPFRVSWKPKWLDHNIAREPTIYYHWFMWPNRARSLFIRRFIELANVAFPIVSAPVPQVRYVSPAERASQNFTYLSVA